MVTVRSLEFAGKTINVPHSEHRQAADEKGREKNAVTFEADGTQEVSAAKAKALLEFYPRQVEVVKGKPAKEYNAPVVSLDSKDDGSDEPVVDEPASE